MAQGQQAQLTVHMDDLARWVVALRKDTTALRDRLEVAYQAMADEQRLALGRYMADVRGQVDQLLNDADQALATQHAARQSMAKEQCQQLAKENQSLRGEVRAFSAQIGAARQQISADQAEARQVWARYSKLMRQHRVRKPQAPLQAPEPPAQEKRAEPPTYVVELVAPEPPMHVVEPTLPEPGAIASPAQEKKAELPTHMAEPVAPEPLTNVAEPTLPAPGAKDDFRAIQGLGLGVERRLHKAGIYRFAQLAAMTTEELRSTVAVGPFVKVESWIERARELAEQK
jgi:predicted flap endonuclease-1-like 5' DNA nuclease